MRAPLLNLRLSTIATLLISLFSGHDLFAVDQSLMLQHFESKVRPVLIERCGKCHAGEKQRGGLSLDSREAMLTGGDTGAAISPGKADDSLLLQMIVTGKMPPKNEPRLTDAQIADIRKWLNDGALMADPSGDSDKSKRAWRDHWAFRKPDRAGAFSSLPEEVRKRVVDQQVVGGTTAPNSPNRIHPIDAFVLTKLAEKKLTSAPRASPQTLVRRAYFDLLGLPPTPEQVDKFINDSSSTAWDALVNELLASPQYGERWGRHWLDVARYADSGGYETDMYYRHAWRYRDYVVKSFNDDKPYDRFVQEQIAGDEIWPDSLELDGNYQMAESRKRALEAHTGTGFYALGPQIHESAMDARKQDYERLTDWVDATGAAFLGVTLGCSRCHDHKFDPFSQKDYYGLQAVFARSRETERVIVNAMEIADYKQHYPHIMAVRAAREAYRQFEKSLGGKPATPEQEAKRNELLLALGRSVLALPERASSTPNTPFDGIFDLPVVAVLGHERPELVKPTVILNRGDLDRPRDAVTPAIPVSLAEATGSPPALPDGLTSRKELALWITKPDHPLTARVMVNRVWQWHFGRGLVATPSDFGKMGQPPSHPELLDWLTTEFVSHGWSIKQLHRLIMTSDTYQLASDFAPDTNLAADPDNRWLWRFNRRRLEGEAVWDSLHAVAGTINLQMGGPPMIPPLNDEELAGLRDRYRWIVSPDQTQHNRRGLYIINYRNFRFPLFEIFDAPNNAVSSPGRDVSIIAPQSLWLLNNHTAWEQAQHLAARVHQGVGDRPAELVTKLWRITLGRPPSNKERTEGLKLFEQLATGDAPTTDKAISSLEPLGQQRAWALIKLSLTMFNHNEFLFID